ncbi:myosin head [Teladorsagia circumcincta]|uniref:Myosin head n=2 Tax=Teladorsagia circumcincta TaxID=45464 RepID=A0A2G9U436_TELCI|nr:myosin head [Teladorsagia circumcincta]
MANLSEYEKDPGWQYLKRSREQMLKDQSQPYDSKKSVWVPDQEEGYVAGEIKSTKGDNAVVIIGDKEKTFRKDALQEMNPPKFEKTEDMSNLTFLNDASVLYNLRARYAAMLIYGTAKTQPERAHLCVECILSLGTVCRVMVDRVDCAIVLRRTYSGLFCVVINPYKRLPIYTESVARMYMGKRRTEMPPHLFAVSDEAYRNMLQDHENQSMLITGESGAGKTENTKKVIAYFASVGASQSAAKTATDEKKVTLEDQIVQTNPVLEAFGNAKTVRNNNSSRFGKFIRIHFSRAGRLASCDIEHYLLEKSRVIRQAPGERCYHIFYQIFSDFKPELKQQLLLTKPLKEYWFVAQAELSIDGVNDSEEFQMTDEAFDILNFSPQEKMDCYRLMAGHMHMGAMKFKQRPREEQAEPDGQEDAEKATAMLVGADELEELKRKQMARVMDLQEALSAAQNKVISLEKAKARLLQDTEDARSDVDRHLTVIASLEKKQKAFDKIVEDWKRKVDDIQKEIDATTRDSRNTSTEVFKLRSAMENLTEYIETLRRENKGYAQEIRDITEQITQGSRTFHDLQKAVLRSQIEVQQIRSEVEKRIQEKEEEFENTRKNHQRALESIQASLETETKSKAELLRAKKKLESDINQLEIALDHANKANVDAQKTLKRLFDQVKELQGQVDDEQRNREEIRENYLAAEKRLAIALAETEDLVQKIDSAEKSRHQLEIDQADLKSQNNELIANNAALSSMKRKVENDVQIARNELDECLNQLKASEERSRKAASDADRLAEEVRQEQEHCAHVERHRKGLELTAKELQAKIEDAERAMLQFGQKALSKVEEKVRQVSAAYHAEARRHQEAVKGLTKQERRSRELQFQVEEDKKMFDRLQEMVEKLQQKIRVQKRQIEEAVFGKGGSSKWRTVIAPFSQPTLQEIGSKHASHQLVGPEYKNWCHYLLLTVLRIQRAAHRAPLTYHYRVGPVVQEEVATQNLSKFRQIQLALENAEERAEVAENSLVRMRTHQKQRVQ